MKISSNMGGVNTAQNSTGIKNLYTEKLTKDEAKELKAQVVENANAFAFKSVSIQSNTLSVEDKFAKDYEEFQSFLKDIGYEGQSIAELSQEEASKLVSEDGFFGIEKTSARISDFVINGANGNEDLLRAGREGILQGFKEAEQIWGGELPEISQKTIAKSVETIDLAMNKLGFSILNKEA